MLQTCRVLHDEPPLADVLEEGLAVVFCGTAAGAVSAARGFPYAGPGNKFWRILAETGLTPRALGPEEFMSLPDFGVGVTDLSKFESGSDRELSSGALDVPGFVEKIERFRPGRVAFNGKNAAQTVRGGPVDYGAQDWRVGEALAHVLPSTSGAASGFWDPGPWFDLAATLPPRGEVPGGH